MSQNARTEDVADLFDGARRGREYEERHDPSAPLTAVAQNGLPPGDDAAAAASATDVRPRQPGQDGQVSVPPAPTLDRGEPVVGKIVSSQEVVTWDPAAGSARSTRGFLRLLGVRRHRKRERLESADRLAECERIIRQATWIRAVNVAVANVKGASGVVPAGLMIGGLLGEIRGGGVAVFEATAERRGLLDLAEGSPTRGLSQLLAGAGQVRSAGTLAGYTAPQTSHAAVIGSTEPRAQLVAGDLPTIRGLLDTYYTATVSVLSHNLESSLGLASLQSADAVVIPTVVSRRALTGVVRTMRVIARHCPHLLGRVVIAVGHSGAPEDPQTVATALEWLTGQMARIGAEYRASREVAQIVPCPHEPAFIADREFSLSAVLPESRRAWSEVTAQAVQRISDEKPVSFEGDWS